MRSLLKLRQMFARRVRPTFLRRDFYGPPEVRPCLLFISCRLVAQAQTRVTALLHLVKRAVTADQLARLIFSLSREFTSASEEVFFDRAILVS